MIEKNYSDRTEKELINFFYDNPSASTSITNKKAPIHRWYLAPMAFSHKLVEKLIELNIDDNINILDPFVGSATTMISAKQKGLNAVGLENHLLMYNIAKGKTNWNFDVGELDIIFNKVLKKAQNSWKNVSINEYPLFLKNCYEKENLMMLKCLWDNLYRNNDGNFDPLFIVLMSSTLRKSISSRNDLPYIIPNKKRKKISHPFTIFKDNYKVILEDINNIDDNCLGSIKIYQDDARTMKSQLRKSFDLIITSPPYLNNIDYADSTRLELYFFKYAQTWNEISKKVRSKLLTAATTQVSNKRMDFLNQLKETLPTSSGEKVLTLAEKLNRVIKEDKRKNKYYDRMIVNYFIEMNEHLKMSYEILNSNGTYYLVVGDSAPYGIPVRTDIILSSMAEEIGYHPKIIKIRDRGGKCVTPRRHNKKLRESLIILRKET